MKIKYFIILISLIACFNCCKNEQEIITGSLVGIVKDEFYKPIEGAEIELSTSPIRISKTNYSGKYYFIDFPVATYLLNIKKDTYITLTESVTLIPNDTIHKDFILKVGTPALSISDSILLCNSFGIIKTINVYSNTSWVILDTCNWISFSTYSGNGNSSLSLSIKENTEAKAREETVKFKAGNIIRELTIIQDFKLKLIDYTGFEGKPTLSDTVFLLFNKPVKAISVTLLLSDYQNFHIREPEIGYINDSNGIKFHFVGSLFKSDLFEFSVIDIKNERIYTDKIVVSHFIKRIDLDGRINDYFITSDNQYCWIAVQNQDELIKVSLEDLSIYKIYKLDFPPLRIRLNPYNKLLYIIPGLYGYSSSDSNLYIFDLEAERIMKIVKLKPHPDDHPSYPSIFPGEIRFAKSGYGILLTCCSGATGGNYDVIDSSLGDSIYHPQNWSLKTNTSYRLYSNFDYSKIYITESNCVIRVVDGDSHEMAILDAPIQPWGMLGSFIPNKKNNSIFLSQYNIQYIFNADNRDILGYVSYYCPGPGGDFSYRQDDENIIYGLDLYYHYFLVTDYKNAKTLIIYPLIESGQSNENLITTTDGKYALISCGKSLYIFNTYMY